MTDKSKILATAVERTKELTEIDMKHKGIWELFGSAAEELGEVATALNVEEGAFAKHKKLDESSKMEAVDLAICGLAIYFARGGTMEDLGEHIHSKLNKWEISQKESK